MKSKKQRFAVKGQTAIDGTKDADRQTDKQIEEQSNKHKNRGYKNKKKEEITCNIGKRQNSREKKYYKYAKM